MSRKEAKVKKIIDGKPTLISYCAIGGPIIGCPRTFLCIKCRNKLTNKNKKEEKK